MEEMATVATTATVRSSATSATATAARSATRRAPSRGDEVVRRLRLLADGHAQHVWSHLRLRRRRRERRHAPPPTSRSPGRAATTRRRWSPPGSSRRFYLPWVAALKGRRHRSCGVDRRRHDRVGAGARQRLPPGQLGAGHRLPVQRARVQAGRAVRRQELERVPEATRGARRQSMCFSYSNDASLLLPSTAMTGNYRVMGQKGWSAQGNGDLLGPYFAITATANNTTRHREDAERHVARSSPAAASRRTNGAGTFTLNMNQGDVVEVMGAHRRPRRISAARSSRRRNPSRSSPGFIASTTRDGGRVRSHRGVRVPRRDARQALLVSAPTSPNGSRRRSHRAPLRQRRRHDAHVQPAASPPGPTHQRGAGRRLRPVDARTSRSTATNAFGVGSCSWAARSSIPRSAANGDPSRACASPSSNIARAYIFLAPSDYDVSYVDIVGPTGSGVQVDGAAVGAFTPIGSSGFGISRHQLGAGQQRRAHAHRRRSPSASRSWATGKYTSYQYPGGSNLSAIAPPPVK